MTQYVHGTQGRLGRHAPKFETRPIMVLLMGGNAACDGEVIDGKHVASKAGDVGDNGGMTCGVEV